MHIFQNEATIASPELMPVTAGGAGSSNMMEVNKERFTHTF